MLYSLIIWYVVSYFWHTFVGRGHTNKQQMIVISIGYHGTSAHINSGGWSIRADGILPPPLPLVNPPPTYLSCLQPIQRVAPADSFLLLRFHIAFAEFSRKEDGNKTRFSGSAPASQWFLALPSVGPTSLIGHQPFSNVSKRAVSNLRAPNKLQ